MPPDMWKRTIKAIAWAERSNCMPNWVFAANTADIPEHRGIEVVIQNQSIALFRYKNDFYALRNQCAHQHAPISGGYVYEGYAVCPHHQWKFKLTDGSFINNETLKLPSYRLKITGGRIYIDREDV
ncbi:MAG: Rieske 2Fe-2S domain-containing protein [Caldithrix sp.]|nr:Rieske 2Fe-2S domain-containing protein [Caldithrix sp.]